MILTDLAVLGASSVAAWTDMRNRRIPNALSAALCAGGAIVNAHEGIWPFLTFAGVLVLVLFAGTLAHANGMLGGGDVKFLAAACATLGAHDAVIFLLATVIAGGILGLIVATTHGRLRATFSNIVTLALPMFAGVRPVALQSGTKMPYALAILAGALVITLLHLS
jgi:Flp pilus assembly protein protease CpaA